MIKEAYVSYEVAKLLKEKGFNIPITTACHKIYNDDRPDTSMWVSSALEDWNDISEENNVAKVYSCPTQALAMRWLREVHNLYIVIFPESDIEVFYIKGFNFDIWTPVGNEYDRKNYKTYEEACEAAIKYCLENLI